MNKIQVYLRGKDHKRVIEGPAVDVVSDINKYIASGEVVERIEVLK